MKLYLKRALLGLTFAISYLGFSVNRHSQRIANERNDATVIGLTTVAEAYCNEAAKGDYNNGLCTGYFQDPTTRCLEPNNPSQTLECKL